MQITLSNSHVPCTQSLHVTPVCDFCTAQLHLRSWVDWAPLNGFAKNATSLECQRSVVLAHDVSRDFFRLCWVSPLINLVYLLSWLFYTKPDCINYQPGKTKMAAVYKFTLFIVRIEPIKAVIFFLVNIKPTRFCETSKNVTIHLVAW